MKAFVPNALPPHPPIEWTPELHHKYDRAFFALGKLSSTMALLSYTVPALYMYLRKEELLSCMISGNRSSLTDILMFELKKKPSAPQGDAREVRSCIAALNYGILRLDKGMPLSIRLLREMHGILIYYNHGGTRAASELRGRQHWARGTTSPHPIHALYVSTPAKDVPECMDELALFLSEKPVGIPVLIKTALAYAQFITICPFSNYNGLIGRLLILLLLHNQQVLKEPALFTSLYFKANRQQYHDTLDAVRQNGDWEAWLDFFADAIITGATQTMETMEELEELFGDDHKKIRQMGRINTSVLRTHRALIERPLATPKWVVKKTGLSPATVNKALAHLEQLNIVEEMTSQKRNRIFTYTRYLRLMSRDTELPTPD